MNQNFPFSFISLIKGIGIFYSASLFIIMNILSLITIFLLHSKVRTDAEMCKKFEGRHFKVARVIQIPYMVGNLGNFYGSDAHLMKYLSKALKFNYEYVMSVDGFYGWMNPQTGKHNGIIGMVERGVKIETFFI